METLLILWISEKKQLTITNTICNRHAQCTTMQACIVGLFVCLYWQSDKYRPHLPSLHKLVFILHIFTLLTLPTPYLNREMTSISWLLIFLQPTIYSVNNLQLSSQIIASKLGTTQIFKKWESGHLLARFDLQNNIRSANITSWYTKFILVRFYLLFVKIQIQDIKKQYVAIHNSFRCYTTTYLRERM